MQPEQSQHGTLKNIMQPKKLRKRLHRVKGQHIFMLNQMTMAYLIQNSFLPCSDVRWICSILTSGRSENKQNRNIECVLLTIKFYFRWIKWSSIVKRTYTGPQLPPPSLRPQHGKRMFHFPEFAKRYDQSFNFFIFFIVITVSEVSTPLHHPLRSCFLLRSLCTM